MGIETVFKFLHLIPEEYECWVSRGQKDNGRYLVRIDDVKSRASAELHIGENDLTLSDEMFTKQFVGPAIRTLARIGAERRKGLGTDVS